MKHNPAFLDDEALVASFCVRQADLDLLVETVRENSDARANQHVLVIGPRGMGKTTLVRRVAAEVRNDEALSRAWFPIVFGEESYAISDAGEFWLEAVLHLADALGDPEWHTLYQELHRESDGEVLGTRALARLTEFADARGVRLLVVVENLQMLLGEQLDRDAASTLRHTLQTEPRIMLLGTAASRFDAIDRPDQPMFDLFRKQILDPLTVEEARALWDAVALRPLTGRKIRPVHILTGGNPRLLAIVASFAADRSFGELMDDLVHLVDEHTTYFKANVEALPAGERKVLVALADLWHRATSRQVAERARLDVNKASAYLKRLVDRGVVSEVDRIGRVRLYELTERLYNIYHLMRRRGSEQAQVKALVEFMVAFYERDELPDLASLIAREACRIGSEQRRFHLWALGELLGRSRDGEERARWLAGLPAEVFELPGWPAELLPLGPSEAEISWKNDTMTWLRALGGDRDALGEFMLDPDSARSVLAETVKDDDDIKTYPRRTLAKLALGRAQEVIDGLSEACVREPSNAMLHFFLGMALTGWSDRRAEAAEAFEQSVDLDPRFRDAWQRWGMTTEDLDTAEKALRHAVDLEPHDARSLALLGSRIVMQGRWQEGVEHLERALELEPDLAAVQILRMHILALMHRGREALMALKDLITVDTMMPILYEHIVRIIPRIVALVGAPAVRDALSGTRAEQMTPLFVALDLMTETPTNPAREVEEVARDIIERVEMYRAQRREDGADEVPSLS
ncbi:MAG: AAA family ATPase [bacterium]